MPRDHPCDLSAALQPIILGQAIDLVKHGYRLSFHLFTLQLAPVWAWILVSNLDDRDEIVVSQETALDNHIFKCLLLFLVRDTHMACGEGEETTHLGLREKVRVQNFIEKGLKVFKES